MTIKLPSTKIVLLLTALSVLAFSKIEASQVKASTFGYNSSDATEALKAAFRSNYDTVIVDYKAAGWNVGPITLFDIKNKVIIFEPGVVLRAITGRFNARNAKLLKLARPLNLTILGYGAKFKMNKAEYTNLDPNTEYRVSFEIQHGVNITVKGLTLEESGGDGVYLSGNTSKNIVLEDLNVINQSRSGITIISADGLLVKNCDFSGTSGPIVGSGIKFEPHGVDDKFIDVRFENCRAFDNGQAGITFGLNHMTSATAPLDVVFKDCYLSNNSIESRRNPNTEIMLSNGTTNYFAPVGGKIRFENLVVENVRKSVFKTRKVYNAVKAEFVNCSFKVKPGSLAAPIAMETPNYHINVPHLGGVSFANTQIEYSNAGPFLAIYGSPTMAGLRDVTGDFLITNPNITEEDAILYTRVNSYINVDINFDILSTPPPPPPPPGGGSDCSNTLNITADETTAGIREAAQTLTASNAILHSSGTVTYKAGDKVTLKTGFSMRANSNKNFKAVLGDCNAGSSALKARIYPYRSNPSAEDNELLKNKSLLYPNPVSDLTELQYVLEEDDIISIAIYDAKYQLVQSVVNAQTRFEGQYAQSLDLSSLTPGLYFVSIEGGSINETLKIIKK